MICSICGKIIEGQHNVDHIYPNEIAKWSTNPLVKKVIAGKNNRAPSHIDCNYEKQDRMPADPFIPLRQKSALEAQIATIRDSIQGHQDKKNMLIQKQGGNCFGCGKPLADVCILRRIDISKERIWTNACVVCGNCNDTCRDFSGR